MNRSLPWIIGISVWLAGGVTYFAFWETKAFLHPDQYDTLSYFIASIGAAWPFGIYLVGFVTGAITSHFYWSWRKNPLNGGG